MRRKEIEAKVGQKVTYINDGWSGPKGCFEAEILGYNRYRFRPKAKETLGETITPEHFEVSQYQDLTAMVRLNGQSVRLVNARFLFDRPYAEVMAERDGAEKERARLREAARVRRVRNEERAEALVAYLGVGMAYAEWASGEAKITLKHADVNTLIERFGIDVPPELPREP